MTTEIIETVAVATEADTSVQKPESVTPVAAERDPQWLGARLERARRELLKDIGVEDVKDAKLALAEFKKLQDAQKTEMEKARERISELEKVAARAKLYDEASKYDVEELLAGLTEVQRTTVLGIAGDDPLQIKNVVRQLRPTWVTAAAEAKEPKRVAAPVTTTAPTPNVTPAHAGHVDHYAVWQQLTEAKDLVAAAHYRLRHSQEIAAAKKSKT